jgi:hypothetical protein
MIDINETILQNFLQIGRQNNEKGWILVFPGGVGDSYIALSLLEAFIEHHKITDRINLIMPSKQASLRNLFVGPYNTLAIPSVERLWTHCQMFSPVPMFHRDVPFPVHPAFIADGRSVHLMGKKEFTFADVLRHILRIPFDSAVQKPACTPEIYNLAEQFAKANGIIKGGAVILFPSARTIKSCPPIFWSELVVNLKSIGLKVFCNIVPSAGEELVEGAIPLEFPLEWSIPLCEHAGFTISTLTGTAVVNSSADAKKIIVAKVDHKYLSSLDNPANINRDQHIWTMRKIGIPFDGSELFFHDDDDFLEAAKLTASLLC